MPFDTERYHGNLDMYLDVLSEICLIRMKYADISLSIIDGDFNTDLSRRISLHTLALLYYLPREGLILCSQSTNDEILYTYENSFTGAQSIIDYLIVSESLSGDVHRYCAIHEEDNLSDHCPIITNTEMNSKYDHSQIILFRRKISWSKAKN